MHVLINQRKSSCKASESWTFKNNISRVAAAAAACALVTWWCCCGVSGESTESQDADEDESSIVKLLLAHAYCPPCKLPPPPCPGMAYVVLYIHCSIYMLLVSSTNRI